MFVDHASGRRPCDEAGNISRRRACRPRRRARCWSRRPRASRAAAAAACRSASCRRRRSCSSANALGRTDGMLVERVEGQLVLPRLERLASRPARRARDRRPAARRRTSAALPSRAASRSAAQSMPGAFFANSARVQGLCALATSSLCSRVACAWAILVSRSKMRSARACGVGDARRACRIVRDVGAVFVRDARPCSASADEVIVAVGHAEPALQQVGQRLARLFRPCVTNRPNRFSVWKLVALSGSTSARKRAADRRAQAPSCRRCASIASRSALAGVRPRVVDRGGVRDRRCSNRRSGASFGAAAGFDLSDVRRAARAWCFSRTWSAM